LSKELNTGTLGTVIKQMEKEKSNYEMIMSKIKRSSEDIQNYVKKFDVIKEEIDSSNKKFENYKLEIDTKKDSITLLETQIENVELLQKTKAKTQFDIEAEKKLLHQKRDTLKNLCNALKS